MLSDHLALKAAARPAPAPWSSRATVQHSWGDDERVVHDIMEEKRGEQGDPYMLALSDICQQNVVPVQAGERESRGSLHRRQPTRMQKSKRQDCWTDARMSVHKKEYHAASQRNLSAVRM